MKRIITTAIIFLGLVGAAPAQQNQGNGGASSFIKPLGYCQFTAQGSAHTLAAASCVVPSRAAWASIIVETASIRWRDDGTSPTTTVGMLINPTSTPAWTYNSDFSKLSFIAVTGSPVVNISFYDGPGLQ